jgi:uncharacterized Fe-S cluster-containing radical SAM superfamily protein
MKYPRFVTPESEPFDPVELARETEKIVCHQGKRKYTAFYATGVYGGIATGYTVGCCLRCIFCWVDLGREFPEEYGRFYSPSEAFSQLSAAAEKYGVGKLRISGAEPTLCRRHLLGLLDLVEKSKYRLFILETNGILFGVDKSYVEEVSKYKKVHVRVSLKAGTAEAFERKTGAKRQAFEIPFKAIENLLDSNASFHVAAMSGDPRIMDEEERARLIEKLWRIDPILVETLEEEVVDPYETTMLRLKKARFEMEWPLRERYKPIKFKTK